MSRPVRTVALEDAAGAAFDLMVAETPAPVWSVLVLPGAQCRAARYQWIADGLRDATVAVLEPPEVMRVTPFTPETPVPTRFASLGQLLAAAAWLDAASPGARRAVIGHSHGGGVLLEALDGAEARRNPMFGAPEAFGGLAGVDVAVTLGAHLQAEAMSFVIPWRDSGRPLQAGRAQVTLIAGEHDRMATPRVVAATAARYAAARFVEVPGANHLNWAKGQGPFDRPDLDGVATIPVEAQQAATLDLIRNALEAA